MADEVLWIDHATDATGSPLQIGMGTSYALVSQSFPAPEQQIGYASSVDTEGELDVTRRYTNRTISLELEIRNDPGGVLLAALQGKMGKLQTEGGTLRRTMKDGTTIRVYDAITANGWDPGYDLTYYLGDVVKVSITIPAKPLARGAAVTQADRVETTLPALVATETGILGDAKATGVLTVDNDAPPSNHWWGLLWGLEDSSDYDIAATSAALFYQAESLTPMGGSAVAVGPAGASGAGSNVVRNTALVNSYQAIVSSQATGAGAHWTHSGTFRVFARVHAPSTNVGTVTVALEWGLGDFLRFTRNDEYARSIDADLKGAWRMVDLGLVNVSRVQQGLQRWEARVVAKSTATGDDIDIDWIMLAPSKHGFGEAQAVYRLTTPTAISAVDDFSQTAGALTGKTLVVGGTWGGAGDPDDFTVETTGGTAQRTALSDADFRYETAGTANFTTVAVQIDVKKNNTPAAPDASSVTHALLARYIDTNNYLRLEIKQSYETGAQPTTALNAWARVAGSFTLLGTTSIPNINPSTAADQGWTTLTLIATASGSWAAWHTPRGQLASGLPLMSGHNAALATGGALATGKVGFADWYNFTIAVTRNYDNFRAWVPPVDAGVFAGQSLQIRSDGVLREDPAGSFWQGVSSYRGGYLKVPQAGAEGYSARYIVKPILHPEAVAGGIWLDDRIDDLSARLTYTPRYLT